MNGIDDQAEEEKECGADFGKRPTGKAKYGREGQKVEKLFTRAA